MIGTRKLGAEIRGILVNARHARRQRSWLMRTPLWSVSFITVILFGSLALAGCTAISVSPDVSQLDWDRSTVIFDREGNEVYRLHAGKNRTPVKLKDVPLHVQEAFLSVEDPQFRNHHGINPRGLARAMWRSGLYVAGLPGGRLEGGSTITQQLARDAWLSHELSISRKVQEAWVAIQLERHYTKDEILEMYINQIYFGRGAYGIDAAAKTFFGKPVQELSIAEGAQLAGMINGPSYFDPYEHPEDSLERRDLVLRSMLKERVIDEEQYELSLASRPQLGTLKQVDSEANYFTDYVIGLLHNADAANRYGLRLPKMESVATAGLKVYTSMNPALQQAAEASIIEQMDMAELEYYGITKENPWPEDAPRPEAAMVAMDPKTGEVLALVGGREHQALLEFNRATGAYRQPGSAIKPFAAYVPALEVGYGPAAIFDDAPVMLTSDGKTVWPQNYDFKYLGLRTMRFGVQQSMNPMAVRAMQAGGGPQRAADYVRRFGLTSVGKEDEHLALALGGVQKGVTVLDMTSAFAALANMGIYSNPVVITKVVGADGQVLFEALPQKRQVVKPGTSYLMVDMMKDVITKGTAFGFTRGFNDWPAAGKTGTTEDNRDAWFVGFTPDIVVSVWNGYDEPKNSLKWTGAFVPVKIWSQFMKTAVPQRPADWVQPAEVVTSVVCRLTGMLPNEDCPKDQVGQELFLNGTEPRLPSDMLVRAKAVQVDQQWQLWQLGCSGTPVERTFIRRPQPRVVHPTDPHNAKYVPDDASNELPLSSCQPVSLWERFFPTLPRPPVLPAPVPPNSSIPPKPDSIVGSRRAHL